MTVQISGLTWDFDPLEFHEQIEVELLLARAVLPALGYALGAVAEELAPPLVSMLRETAGEQESFDLSHLLNLDTKDPRIASAFEKVLEGAGRTLGAAVRGGAATVARLDVADAKRLFELAVLGKALVSRDGSPLARITDWSTFSRLCERVPGVKWSVLTAALRNTYGGAEGSANGEQRG
jgi:hypothetical protein